MKYQQTHGWIYLYLAKFKTYKNTEMCLSLPEFISIFKISNSESRSSILQLVWNRIETRLQNKEICMIGCLMQWRSFQYELSSLIMRIFTRFMHRNSKRRYYNYRLNMTPEQTSHNLIQLSKSCSFTPIQT